MNVFRGVPQNKPSLKEEGGVDPPGSLKIRPARRPSFFFSRYNNYKFVKWQFESQNMPVAKIVQCINTIMDITASYATNLQFPGNWHRKQDFMDVNANFQALSANAGLHKEEALKFNVDKLYEQVTRIKATRMEQHISNPSNADIDFGQPSTAAAFESKPDLKKTRYNPAKLGKTKVAKAKPEKTSKSEKTLNESNLGYFLKYTNHLRLYYQYYLSHFKSVHSFYSTRSNRTMGSPKNRMNKAELKRAVSVLDQMFVYLKKLMSLHLKYLAGLLPFPYPLNIATQINAFPTRLNDSDPDPTVDDSPEVDMFDLDEFTKFLESNNLIHKLNGDTTAPPKTNTPPSFYQAPLDYSKPQPPETYQDLNCKRERVPEPPTNDTPKATSPKKVRVEPEPRNDIPPVKLEPAQEQLQAERFDKGKEEKRRQEKEKTKREQLGKELKGGKKLNSKSKFNTLNIKQIFQNITNSASSSTDATGGVGNTASGKRGKKGSTSTKDKHIGYKSRAVKEEPQNKLSDSENSISSIDSLY